jgi:hypothetical protein
VAAALTLTIGAAAVGRAPPTLRIELPDGREVASVRLPDDGTLALRYRNSLYGTLAEERFAVTDEGRLRLVALRAEQLAVLEEYYAIDTPARRIGTDGLAWEADPALVPSIETLRVAATDRGERTLLVPGQPPVELWRFVGDAAPSVMLEVER